MGVDVFDTLDESSMKCIRFDVCKAHGLKQVNLSRISSMKCIRFDVCKGKHIVVKVKNDHPQ